MHVSQFLNYFSKLATAASPVSHGMAELSMEFVQKKVWAWRTPRRSGNLSLELPVCLINANLCHKLRASWVRYTVAMHVCCWISWPIYQISNQFSNWNFPCFLENFLNLDRIRTGETLSIKEIRKGVQSRENLNPLPHRQHTSLIEDKGKRLNFHAVPEEEASS